LALNYAVFGIMPATVIMPRDWLTNELPQQRAARCQQPACSDSRAYSFPIYIAKNLSVRTTVWRKLHNRRPFLKIYINVTDGRTDGQTLLLRLARLTRGKTQTYEGDADPN